MTARHAPADPVSGSSPSEDFGLWVVVRQSLQASPLGFAAGDKYCIFLALKVPQRDRHSVCKVSQSCLCSCKLLSSRRPSFLARVWTCHRWEQLSLD